MRVWRAGRSRRAQDAARFAAPIAPPLWPPLGDHVDEPVPRDEASPDPDLDPDLDTPTDVPAESHSGAPVAPSAPAPVVAVQLEMQAEFLRLLEVVTSMCDHVIEYIETDRAERRVLVETLTDLGRVITEGAAAAMAAAAAMPMIEAPPTDARADEQYVDVGERLIGGSMPAGPEPVIDLVAPEAPWEPASLTPIPGTHLLGTTAGATARDAAVEVRGRIGDRWIDGFEICEVMTTPAGPRYRLRRRLDGAVLPELFEASSIRHVDPVDHHAADVDVAAADDGVSSAAPQYWSRS